jgi:hypothetical protein
MKRLSQLALLSTGLVFALFACGGRGGGGGDDSSGDDVMMPDGPPGGVVKVKDVQNDAMPDGTAVELRGVIVTAIDGYGSRTGDIWVQDAEGGEFSGIKVFGVSPDQLLSLTVGDIVDIANAEKDEFKYMSGSSMDEGSVTELKGAGGGMMTVTKKGAGTAPTPAMVDAKALAAMDKATREAEWEKWEGVLIKVVNARQLAPSRMFGAGEDQNEFRISGIARVQTALTAFPAGTNIGVCYDSITGLGDHFFNDLVLPRSAADVVTSGTGCSPMATSVSQMQTATGQELIMLSNVVVTAIGTGGKGYWVADAVQAATNNGVYVYTGADPAPTTTIGAVVNVNGFPQEFDAPTAPTGDKLTELSTDTGARGTIVNATGPAPIPLTATVAQVGSIANSEAYEGVLVKLSGVKVSNIAGTKVTLSNAGGDTIRLDNDTNYMWTMPAANTCYTTLVGVMSVDLTDDVRTINPTSAADMVVDADGSDCD